MERLLKHYILKLCPYIPVQKLNHRIIYLFIVALISLISVFGIHNFVFVRAMATEPVAAQLICTKTPNLSPEQLSIQGRESYDNGRFDEAIDCWQKAVVDYRKQGNETETINNQINLAQAEQRLGLLPRACSTLLSIYGEENCKIFLRDEEKLNNFREKLKESDNSPANIAALRSFGKVLRSLGELNLSHEILGLTLEKSQPQEKPAIWLDLGNTRRALSNKEQDLYYRSREQQNLICAIIYADAATKAYKMAEGEIDSTSASPFNTKLQSQLNQLSLTLDLQDWYNYRLNKQTKDKADVLKNLFRQNSSFLYEKGKSCWKQVELNKSGEEVTNKTRQPEFKNEIRQWLWNQLSNENPLIQSPQINKIKQQIEKLPVNHTALFTKLNFAKNLMRIENVPTTKINQLLGTSIEQAQGIRDSKIESYGYGYLGELYEKRGKLELAKENTRKALLIAQSTELGSESEYLWQWQLGRIYKSQIPPRTQVKTKKIQSEGLKNLNPAREMYQRAYLTLQSLRRELVAGNPDSKFSFQNDIESIYRDYVNLLLWDDNPDQDNLFKGREVIASLQAVELENFLRVACPEYNVAGIDAIIDKQAPNTAFLYPIVLEDRIEVVVKLPDNTGKTSQKSSLEHYRKPISDNFEEKIRKFQINLEEEYTFEDVIKEGKEVYDLLLQGAEKIISNNKGIDTLVFALDTNLRNIPLGALVVDDKINPKTKEPTYLIDKYAVALAPELEIPRPRIIQDQKLRVLAAGLTEPNAEQYGQEFAEYVERFGKLRFATKEIDEIEEIGGSKISVSKLLDQDFNTEQLDNKVNKSSFQILHLATHGEFSSNPEQTFLLTSNKPIVVNELGNIFRKQAQNQPEPIEIIVLSACETAAGDQRATLGISGVAVRAGARSAIASLWTLDDEISVEFTKHLYEQLLKPELTKAQALQQAQLELRKSSGREHPRYWAPYILLGNWL